MSPQKSNAITGITTVSFPKKIILGGADVLMLAFDRIFRKDGHRGNICALALHVNERHVLEEKSEEIVRHDFVQTLYSARLCRRYWRPYWKFSGQENVSPLSILHFSSEAELEDWILKFDCRPELNSPIAFFQFQLPRTQGLLFFWHHALMDARGGEIFLSRLLSSSQDFPVPEWIGPPKLPVASWNLARLARNEILRVTASPFVTFAERRNRETTNFRYYNIRFSAAETRGIDKKCIDYGAEVFKSSVYLAAVSRAVKGIFVSRGETQRTFHLSVPHNLRRAKNKFPLANQVTFFFYRIPFDVLDEVPKAVRYLIDATHNIIQENLQRATESFFACCSFLPLRLYEYLLLKPTKGALASFYFSDVGEIMPEKSLDAFVDHIVHYPPHFARPGFTTVFSRYRSELRAMIIVGSGVASEEEIAEFERTLRHDLCGDIGKVYEARAI